ncbi:hypothetical protein BDA96_07G035000 [Sorghum bicolor]|uniref:Uncharacterized protein n=2 Tax=Sorghum bicolor TaxID=4558 RepID=A0A921U8K4_SORBI|nr:hypothetical protein BDA96_07G035000 [Sorghum bicolor]KAG0522414.1 hypothetical protein BDA96_07G035000 [Sorghum bicolor]KXG24374.1 hypothetical protein SORBI_3007G033600 [Sorghum bicolor]
MSLLSCVHSYSRPFLSRPPPVNCGCSATSREGREARAARSTALKAGRSEDGR